MIIKMLLPMYVSLDHLQPSTNVIRVQVLQCHVSLVMHTEIN